MAYNVVVPGQAPLVEVQQELPLGAAVLQAWTACPSWSLLQGAAVLYFRR